MLVPEEIETFLAIARFGSLGAAAEALHASQSTVSYRLQALERRMGQRLVERARGDKRTTLSTAGANFLAVAERWEDLAEETRRIRNRHHVPVRIGAADAIAIHVLPPVLRELTEDPTAPRITVETATGPGVCDRVALSHLDVGFVFFERVHADLRVEPVATSEMRLFLARGSEAGAVDGHPVSLRELRLDREVRLPWGPDLLAWRQRFPWSEPLAEVAKAFALWPFLQAPDVWAVAPAFMAADLVQRTGCTVHPVVEEPPARTIYRITHRKPRATIAHAVRTVERTWARVASQVGRPGTGLHMLDSPEA
ncbi:DNA-binding transcriptional LysR family regulator [Saccharopolyspora erythraea NRRL 2338]|uniref:Uncharacterized protein n=2 Tax=Saccharopolyspora erythraea TaxID=1836 RepID=A4FDB7_SACEN|nr:LysR family transcriptional regulator [Saccharopolyspora erythraea]EQD81781.1 hypothetical protein N599_34245 [Saccharopolyspora erythraea D]PFG95785.1 DNA-binding transcriptional LysR family regulator [Saccharopolyspora erythraea NRRL 2338]QRK92372.1 LysR family transcriptional regulator [Saccharopolyspora erythraea]CAM02042.1 hypothetical protein SACE_2761 [Saccharopolyspora erythraea NRRL 2338]